MAISDLEAIKAIERCLFNAPRSLDLIGLKEWIAAHCGLNPHAAGPLDPAAKLVAERDKLRAAVAALRDGLEPSPPASARIFSIYNSRSVNPVVASNIEMFVGVA